MIPGPFMHLRHEGDIHRMAPLTRQERRLRRFQDAAARLHAMDPGPRVFVQTPTGIRVVGRRILDGWDASLAKSAELHGVQHEPKVKP